jgi:hypothetical protein
MPVLLSFRDCGTVSVGPAESRAPNACMFCCGDLLIIRGEPTHACRYCGVVALPHWQSPARYGFFGLPPDILPKATGKDSRERQLARIS